MADNTLVNGQITDAVTQANVSVLGSAPAAAMMSLSQVSAQVFGLMMQNAASAQQNASLCAQAAANQGVLHLSAVGALAAKLGQSDVPDNMLSLLAALRAGTAPLPVA